MAQVVFDPEQVASELRAIVRIAAPFLLPEAKDMLDRSAYQLQAFVSSGVQEWTWELRRATATEPHLAVRTKEHKGTYQEGARGHHSLQGELSWTISLKKVARNTVAISGNASMSICIWRLPRHSRRSLRKQFIAFNFDVGQASGPGPCMHAQVKAFRGNTAIVGQSEIDIPRIPSLIATPPDCVDYLLSQLFQEKWHRRFHNERAAEAQIWVKQRQRFATLFNHAQQSVLGANDRTGWQWMRTWIPRFC